MSPIDLLWRLLLAAGLAAALGLEREYRRKPAGLRTNILIALGSALLSTLSIAIVTAAIVTAEVSRCVFNAWSLWTRGGTTRGRAIRPYEVRSR